MEGAKSQYIHHHEQISVSGYYDFTTGNLIKSHHLADNKAITTSSLTSYDNAFRS